MTEQQLTAIETALAANGYRKYTTCLTSHEARGWFKSWIDDFGDVLYQIEWRVWDYRNHPYIPEPYSIDTLVLDGGSHHRIDLEITSPKFDIPTVEHLASDLHTLLAKYIIANATI